MRKSWKAQDKFDALKKSIDEEKTNNAEKELNSIKSARKNIIPAATFIAGLMALAGLSVSTISSWLGSKI